jgi:hypothetical protein
VGKIMINIGQYDENGVFKNENWNTFTDNIGKICNNVRIYTYFCVEQINKTFSNYAHVSQEEFPDLSATLKAYYLRCYGNELWDTIKTCNFNIDTGITNIYFLKDDIYKAELSVEDDVNYVELDISLEEKELFSEYKDFEGQPEFDVISKKNFELMIV